MNRRERRRQSKEARGGGRGGKAASHGIKGEQLAGEGKIDEAIKAFRRAISIDPYYGQSHYNLGLLLHKLGQLDEAIESYLRATAIKPDYGKAHNNLGYAFQELGRLDEAVASYHKALDIKPDFAEAHYNLGNAFQELGRLDEAVASFHKALAIKSDFAAAHSNLGNAFQELGRLDEAVASFHKALAIKSDFAEAHYNLGNAFQKLGRLDEAVASFHKALAIKPDFAEAHYNLGNAFQKLGRLDEAVASFHKALAIKSDYTEAHNNLGLALQNLGKLDEAMASYHKALDIKPDFAEAHINLGLILNGLGQFQESLARFEYKLAYERGENPIDPNHRSFRIISKPKIDHDIEQFRYLASLGNDHERFNRLAESYEAVRKEIDWSNSGGFHVPLSDDHRQRIGQTYNRAHHVVEAPKILGPAINPEIDVATITRDYFKNSPGMIHFDGLLTAEALAALRRFLLESTIWFDIEHLGGYLGTYLSDGFVCPLILQIAEELRLTFPDIFHGHLLTQLWAYKYDSRMSGINLHADFAAININFWVTPDSANLDPDHGGLVVYDVEAPLDWNFKSYNTDVARMKKFLAENDSGKMIVPYAENRVVMFNSDLFHETDVIDFKPGYENRRINITLLFGQRYN